MTTLNYDQANRWRVVSIVETTGLSPANQVSAGKKVTAQVQGGLGTTFSVFVPDQGYTAALAKAALDQAYEHIVATETLSG